MQYTTHLFAQAYGACSYGGSTYQNSTCQTTTTTTTGTSGGASLTNTGFDVLLVASLACAIIFAALVIRFWKRPKRQKNLPNSSNLTNSTQQDAAVGRVDKPGER
jgi:peptidoglycan/LPS O-acetylase OafA/YrhL